MIDIALLVSCFNKKYLNLDYTIRIDINVFNILYSLYSDIQNTTKKFVRI